MNTAPYYANKKLDAIAHEAIASIVDSWPKENLFFIDATAGNGRDALFLARLAGEKGFALALDIQPQAIENARRLLKDYSFKSRIAFLLADHQAIGNAWARVMRRQGYPKKTSCAAIMFNLGYLPRNEQSITLYNQKRNDSERLLLIQRIK